MKLFKSKTKEEIEEIKNTYKNLLVKETETQKELKHLREYINNLDSKHMLGLITNADYQYELMLIDNSVSELERVLL